MQKNREEKKFMSSKFFAKTNSLNREWYSPSSSANTIVESSSGDFCVTVISAAKEHWSSWSVMFDFSSKGSTVATEDLVEVLKKKYLY